MKSRLTYANVVATLAVFLGLGGGAYAVTGMPGRDGVFHGCVSNKTGVLRVVRNSTSCIKPKTHGRHRTSGEFAVSWNQQGPPGKPGQPGQAGQPGQPGQPGAAGPGAVKLYFDRAPDNQLVALGTVGPWTIQAQCKPGSAVNLKVLVAGPGFADAGYTDQLDGSAPVAQAAHQDLSADGTVFSFGQSGGHKNRDVGTIVLSAAPASPVADVSFLAVDDAVTPGGHCSFIGTATPAT